MIDRRLQDPFMSEAYGSLSAMIEKTKTGGVATAEDQARFNSDFTEMAKVREGPFKAAYLELANEFLARRAGTYREHKLRLDARAGMLIRAARLQGATIWPDHA